MQTVEQLGDENFLERLTSCLTVEGVRRGTNNELIKQIKGFQLFFQRLSKTPAMLRMMLHREFAFDGQVDFTKHKLLCRTKSAEEYPHKNSPSLLKLEWYPSTFVVPDYGDMETWSRKMLEEAQKGKTVVAVVPARTNTSWFHKNVIPHAEIRFLMGRLTFPGFRSQSPFPDLVAIYRGTNFKREEGEREEEQEEQEEEVANTAIDLYNHKRSKIAILSSFTGDTDLIRQCVDEDEDGDGDGDGDAYKGYGDEDEDENGDDDDGDQQYDEQEVRRRTKSAMVKRR